MATYTIDLRNVCQYYGREEVKNGLQVIMNLTLLLKTTRCN